MNRPGPRRLAALTQALGRSDPVMAQLIAAAGPCRLLAQPLHTPFESLARSIAHQQIHGTAAARILERLVALQRPAAFPTPSQILAATPQRLRAVGFSQAKIRALRDLAQHAKAGIVPKAEELHALEDEAIIERLTRVRGIGRWTVQMLLMSQLGRTDVLPVDDFGVRNGFQLAYGLRQMPAPRQLAAYGERWRPQRTLAAWYLWRAVDLARAGALPAPPAVRPRLKPKRRRAALSKGRSTRARAPR